MSTPITVELALDAPVAQVWTAWTDAGQLARWLTEKANVRAEVGGPYELFWELDHPERNSTLGCTLTAVEPKQRLAFTWRGPVPYAHLMNQGEPPPTHVDVRFESEGDTTVVRFEHLGWGTGQEWDEAKAWQEKAWRGAFHQLAALMKSSAPSAET